MVCALVFESSAPGSTETGKSSGLMGHLGHMQTLHFTKSERYLGNLFQNYNKCYETTTYNYVKMKSKPRFSAYIFILTPLFKFLV